MQSSCMQKYFLVIQFVVLDGGGGPWTVEKKLSLWNWKCVKQHCHAVPGLVAQHRVMKMIGGL